MDSDYYNDPDDIIKEAQYENRLHYKPQGKLMQIQIIATSVETKPTAKGSYQQLEVTFKNLTYQGKTESKKIMSFGANAPAFAVLKDAQNGAVFDVTVVKNAAGFNDWTAVVPSSGGPAQASAPAKSNASPRSTYETPEERAQRQVLIVRQSSLSAAVATLSVGAKAVKPSDVIAVAREYENYVFDIKAVASANPGPSGFEDIPDFDVAVV